VVKLNWPAELEDREAVSLAMRLERSDKMPRMRSTGPLERCGSSNYAALGAASSHLKQPKVEG
jgi:hypothetical protein